MQSILFFIINLLIFFLILSIAIYAYKRKTPMNFWSGIKVDSEKFKNKNEIAEYNRENGNMWLAYSIGFIFCGVINFFYYNGAIILFILLCTLALPILIVNYFRISKKYFK